MDAQEGGTEGGPASQEARRGDDSDFLAKLKGSLSGG
jgi:hypothetical protein